MSTADQIALTGPVPPVVPRPPAPVVARPPAVRPFREVFQETLRDRILDVAAAAAIDRGWQRVRIADIAAEAGLSRASLNRQFGSKTGLGRALVAREAERVLDEIARRVRAAGDWDTGVAGVFDAVLRAGGDHPLVGAVLGCRHDDTSLLPLLTTRSAPILTGVRGLLAGFLGRQYPTLPADVVADVVDTLARAALSHLALPELTRDDAVERLRRLARQLVG